MIPKQQRTLSPLLSVLASVGFAGLVWAETVSAPGAPSVNAQVFFHAEYVLPKGGTTAHPEIPPWQIWGGWHEYLVGNGVTYKCADPSTLIPDAGATTSPVTFDAGCVEVSQNAEIAHPQLHGPLTGNFDTLTKDGGIPAFASRYPNDLYLPNWIARRSYNSIFSAHVVDSPQGLTVVSVNHGESKNTEYVNGCATPIVYRQNSVNAIPPERGACSAPVLVGTSDNCGPAQSNYSQLCAATNNTILYDPGSGFSDYLLAYSGFVHTEWQPYTQQTNWAGQPYLHAGPIVWPQDGYLKSDGTLSTNGVRHPTSIVYDNYLYVFYQDTSANEKRGIRIARGLVPGGVGPGGFQVYDSRTGDFTEPALPAGFEMARIREFFTAPGPQAPPIPETGLIENTQRFAVAKVKNTPYFMALQIDNRWPDATDNVHTGCQMSLRLSTDLVNWGPRMPVWTTPEEMQCRAHYPIFLDKNGGSHEAIDKDEFYILGGAFVSEVNGSSAHRIQLWRVALTWPN